MRRQGQGKIINLGSLSSEIAIPNIALYATSKGGMRQLTRALALEWAGDNIQVNAIAPGIAHTALTDDFVKNEQGLRNLLRDIPLRRINTPREVALLAVYLASDASNYVTGQQLIIDGGGSAR